MAANRPAAGAGDPERDTAVVSALTYIPPLFFLPFVLSSGSADSRFHGRQSLVLLSLLAVFAAGVWVSDLVFGRLLGGLLLWGGYFVFLAKLIHYPLGLAASLMYAALVVVGAVRAAAGQRWRIPFIASLADRLPFWQ
jgi:uncharacterized membrane protein